ncbi:MAG: SRPBCC family protein [Planctomycetaceae bacterium]
MSHDEGETASIREHRSPWWRLWFGESTPVSQAAYVVTGVSLMLLKYAAEAGLVYGVTGRFYSPLDFATPLLSKRQAVFAGAPDWLGWTIVAWSIPFVWIAVSMSVRRAWMARLTPWAGLMVLMPLLNLPAMVVLALLPDRRRPQTVTEGDAVASTAEHADWGINAGGAVRKTMDNPYSLATLVAISAGELLLGSMLVASVYWLNSYGAMLFFVAPFAAGAVTGFLANRPHVRGLGHTLGVVSGMLCLAALGLLLFALEGLICIIMAVPIVFPLGLIGGSVGYAISLIDPHGLRSSLPCLAMLPLGLIGEKLTHQPVTRAVTTHIEIAASPAEVWRHVVTFPEIPAAKEWYFQAGIAYPTTAYIKGTGVGAVRHCVFTTGEFVEPITVWDEPVRLAFDVSRQPEPMFELTPYHHIHPPHLAGTFRSTKGEFRLVDLGDGRTRLEGTTWYVIDMGPEPYWLIWTDAIIHRIHLRVLEHIRTQATG